MQADEFRQWREQTGYTQAAAAARFFKVTRATLQNWESGATPIPAAVDSACPVWARRVRQEDAGYGPVILIFADGPMFRDPYGPAQRQPVMHKEQYAMNAQAVARVCDLWGRDDFDNPFIIERAGETLWTAGELARVVEGKDSGAPTRANLLRQCTEAVKALADNARQDTDIIVWTGSPMPTAGQKAAHLHKVEALAVELDELAAATQQCTVSYQQVEERLGKLRRLGKMPANSLVSNLARAFVALDALPRPEPPRGSIHPSERADFETELRRRQRSPDEFVLSTADPPMTPGAIQSTRDLVVVRHRKSGAVRGYSYMTWVTDFVRDLEAGAF